MSISVIICSHNPRPDYLRRTLAALKAQSLPAEQWELLLVDNASEKPLAGEWNVSWHPRARFVCEQELGLTPARLRGIRESTGRLLVFVDDDNVLAEDYLAQALSIHESHPHLGAFGACRILGEFETPVPPEVVPFLPMLALRDDSAPALAKTLEFNRSLPYGAGLCVLREVAASYAMAVEADGCRRLLGRCGTLLLSCEDVDLALFACKLGMHTGVFPELQMKHLIPAKRLEHHYLVRLAEGHAASHLILARIWGHGTGRPQGKASEHLRHWFRLIKLRGLKREVYLARRRGETLARARLAAFMGADHDH